MVEDPRYGRITSVRELDLSTIRKCSICVVGAGALGNEVLKNIVLYGPKELTVLDFDRVERSNLGRCFLFSREDAETGIRKADAAASAIGRMNDDVEVRALAEDARSLDHEFFSGFDMVLGCMDNIASRLHVNANCYYCGVPYVDGGIDGLAGRVQVVIPPDGACYQCTVNATHMSVVDLGYTCTGREANVPRRLVPSEPSVSSLTGSLQSLEAARIAAGKGEAGRMLLYNGLRNELESVIVSVSGVCDNHGCGKNENHKD